MSRTEYDVAEPGTPRDTATDPPPGPACPHCGSGPPVPVPELGIVCKSCARIVGRRVPAGANVSSNPDAPPPPWDDDQQAQP